MSKAIENLNNYIDSDTAPTTDKDQVIDELSKTELKAAPTSEGSDFTIKSLDFIEDKMTRGVAKKTFMSCKRAGSDINTTIDTILSDLDSVGKLNNEMQNQLQSFKSSDLPTNNASVKKEETKDESSTPALFDIKLLNDIDDKMIRGTAKKIYMAGKRGNKSSSEVVDDILDELSDKIDNKIKDIIGGLK